MNILEYQNFYLVGIKGVAMTSLAQCLVDAGKSVRGSDVAEEFVTQKILNRLKLKLDVGFEEGIPEGIEYVVFTSAHAAHQNPQVKVALQKNIPTFSQAEAIASLFNQKKGIAVCGVGGKSTTSAMITWILEKTGVNPSFSVGVGNIPGLEKTGQWADKSEYFVAEADEYVIDPSAPSQGKEITPRFSFMKPFVTVCTNIKFDHTDVYKDFEHTKHTYRTFFGNLKEGGTLVMNSDDQQIIEEMEDKQPLGRKILFFGNTVSADFRLTAFHSQEGTSTGTFSFEDAEYQLTLQIPGEYNMMNALAAVAAAQTIGVPIEKSIEVLKDFRSTQRRAEFVGEKNGVKYYDDYAHHPNEVKKVIQAFRQWFPNQRLVVGFQSHTFSRTKSLFKDFVKSFDDADKVVMIDIFPSAREAFDASVTSELLCQEIMAINPQLPAKNVKTIEKLAEYCQNTLQSGDVFLTVGAGDIYKVHELL
jgi:UDP-N-acetylmuramate--alanine ligase